MIGTVFYVATAVIGITIGWEQDNRGELVCIVQIEPEAVESMVEGTPIEYSLPREHPDVRHFRFQIGNKKLLQLEDLPLHAKETSPGQPDSTSGPDTEKQPGRSLTFPDQQGPAIDPGPREAPKFDILGPSNHPATEGSRPLPPLPPDNAALKRIPNDPDIRPINQEQPAVHYQSMDQKNPPLKKDTPSTPEDTSSASQVIAWCMTAGLAAALVYLSWIHLGMRRRYQTLLADYQSVVSSQ